MSVQIGSVKTMSYLLELTYISKLEFNLNVNSVLVFCRFQEQCKSCTFNYIVSIQKDFSGHWTQNSPYFCILTCYIQGPVEKQNNKLLKTGIQKTGISFCLLSCQWHHCEHQQSRIISARVCNVFSSGSRSKIRLLLTFLSICKSFTEAQPIKTEYHLCARECPAVPDKSDSCLKGTN